jgi:hypothetical protein
VRSSHIRERTSIARAAGRSAAGSAGDSANFGVDEQRADSGGSRYLSILNIDLNLGKIWGHLTYLSQNLQNLGTPYFSLRIPAGIK